MKQVYIRVRQRTLDLLDTLAEERGEGSPELRHRSLEIGSKLLAITMPANWQTGTYGDYSPEELARELRPYMLLLQDFLQSSEKVPATVSSPASITPLEKIGQNEIDYGYYPG